MRSNGNPYPPNTVGIFRFTGLDRAVLGMPRCITAYKRRAARDEPTGARITIAPANAGAFDIKEPA